MKLVLLQNNWCYKKNVLRLKAHFQHSQIYESKTLQEKAKSLIPVVQLQSEAEKRLKKISDTTSGTGTYCKN